MGAAFIPSAGGLVPETCLQESLRRYNFNDKNLCVSDELTCGNLAKWRDYH